MIVFKVLYGPGIQKSLNLLSRMTSLAVFVLISENWLFCTVGINIMLIALEVGSRKMMAALSAEGKISEASRYIVVIASGDT